ncbi:MAG: hypothetical protein K0R68_2375 [Mycobacterium sp.]|nr:hypothetical protein [Mycobacterium sp.]
MQGVRGAVPGWIIGDESGRELRVVPEGRCADSSGYRCLRATSDLPPSRSPATGGGGAERVPVLRGGSAIQGTPGGADARRVCP